MAAPVDVTIDVSATGGPAPFTITVTPDGVDPEDGTVEFVIVWGDDKADSTTVAGEPVAHVYTSPGQYTIAAVAAVGGDSTDADDTIITVAAPNTYPAIQNDGGVCAEWITIDDVCAGVTPAQQRHAAAAVLAATRWMNDATGRRWGGPCTSFVRPDTSRDDVCPPHLRHHNPIDLSLFLVGPILSIIEIRVDGEPIDPTWAYLNGNLLYPSTGFDDEDSPLIPWPRQDWDRPPGAANTWDLLVEHGSGPPEPLAEATRRLACELVKQACGDDTCALPSNMSSISRDGVTISFAPPGPGRTGIPFIDAQIALYGPGGYGTMPPRLLDPAASYRTQVGHWPT